MMKLVLAPFRRAEENDDDTLTVSGIASTESVDAAGEIIKASAVAAAIPSFMKAPALREMHSLIAAGKVTSLKVEKGQTLIEALVVDKSTISKIRHGVLRGFSVGGKVQARDPKNSKIITKMTLSEVSVVDVPCQAEA